MNRPEVALTGSEHDRCGVHAHLVGQTRGKLLATAVARSDLDDAVTREHDAFQKRHKPGDITATPRPS
ncbi:hypothetical protein J2W15_004314 [Pseudarthrobacter sulfonivorans]|nr:hypothetical protein [Pseudarthrobacter sulfonivorans]